MLWCCWLGGRKGNWPVKNIRVVGCWCGCLSGARCRLALWPSWCHCHPLSLASVKSWLVLPFWYRLTWVVPDKGPLNGCVCVCVCVYLLLLWQFQAGWYSSCHSSSEAHHLATIGTRNVLRSMWAINIHRSVLEVILWCWRVLILGSDTVVSITEQCIIWKYEWLES